jgi:hypothetical protein
MLNTGSISIIFKKLLQFNLPYILHIPITKVYTKGGSQVPYFVNNAVMPKIVGNSTVIVAIDAIPIQ